MKKKIFILIVVLGAIALFHVLGLSRFLTLTALKENRETLMTAYHARKSAFIMGFILIYTAQTALSLPGAAILTLAGGALFGAVMGTVWVNIGATTGALLAFLLARSLFRDWAVTRFGPKMEALDRGLKANGLSYLLFLRLVPLFPFFLVNLACGVTGLNTLTYVVGTMLGILPGSFVYANAGASLASVENIRQVAGPRVLFSLVLLGIFALIPALYKIIAGKRVDN
ncbi:MAG TPA: TVP38/TMEM64 family protein [Desulfomonilia bacterium]|nr:TVP38/TMEM64 family protein [Desulfomonilia bacterium]